MDSPIEHSNESSFILTTVVVIALLLAFTLIIVVVSRIVSGSEGNDPQLAGKVLTENTAPFGVVTTDASQLPKAPAAVAHAPQSGAQVVAAVCSSCHVSGMLGAPKIGDKSDWSKRLAEAGGKIGDLAAIAIKGKGSMPARGGDASLSDDEIKGAIQEMLKRTGIAAN